MSPFWPDLLRDLSKMRHSLPPGYVRKATQVILFIWLMAFIDVFSLAAILPIVGLLLDTTLIHSNSILNGFYAFWGFEQDNHFILAAILVVFMLFIFKNWVGVAVINYQSRFVYDVASYFSERGLQRYYEKDFLAISHVNTSVPIRDVLMRPVEFSVYVLLASLTFLSELAVFVLILATIAIFSLETFAILILALGPPIAVVAMMKHRRMNRVAKLSAKLKSISAKYLQDNFRSYTDVKLYRKEAFFTRRFVETQRELNRHFSLIHTLGLMPPRVIELAAGFGMAAVLFYGLLSFQAEKDIIILLSLFVAAAYRIMSSTNRMLNAVLNMKTYQHTTRILHESGDLGKGFEPVVDEGREPFYLDNHFALEGISFRYPDNPNFQLNKISISVKRGEIVGIIGKPGSGKSTLMYLLFRFLREQSGRITVDGKPLLPGETRAWQGLIGYVKQDPFLIDGTILENIAFGDDESDLDRAYQAAGQAGLQEFIDRQPLGIDAIIGQGGIKLSGGQKQRIVIARALYRTAEILIFAETTNELDLETERDTHQAIFELAGANKAILIFAHRISTLQNCHRIYELDRGQINSALQYDHVVNDKAKNVEV